jgi:hypothetical protein
MEVDCKVDHPCPLLEGKRGTVPIGCMVRTLEQYKEKPEERGCFSCQCSRSEEFPSFKEGTGVVFRANPGRAKTKNS